MQSHIAGFDVFRDNGDYNAATERFTNVIYMPCTAENNFTPELPKETPDLIYLCFPNNPTGAMVSKAELQKWVDYANKVGAIILYDAAYEAYISEKDIRETLGCCVVVTGTACHYVGVYINRINRVAYSDLVVQAEDLLNVAAVAFCAVRYKNFIR